MKKTKWLLMLLVLLLVIPTLTGCGKETIELTPENIKDYLSFSTDVTDGTVEETSMSVLGLPYTNFTGSGVYTLNAVANTSASFEHVTISIDLIVGEGRTLDAWNFVSGSTQICKYSDDIGRYVKPVVMTISNDGNGSVSENMELDITESDWETAIGPVVPSELASFGLRYEIVSVSGSVIVDK